MNSLDSEATASLATNWSRRERAPPSVSTTSPQPANPASRAAASARRETPGRRFDRRGIRLFRGMEAGAGGTLGDAYPAVTGGTASLFGRKPSLKPAVPEGLDGGRRAYPAGL